MAVFLREPNRNSKRHFVGFGPVRKEAIRVEIGRGCIVDDNGVVGDGVVDIFDLTGAELDIVVDADGAIAAEVDFVGKDECGVDEVIYFSVVAVLCDGVTDEFDVGFAKHLVACIAKTGEQVRANDVGTVLGVVFLAANHTAIVKQPAADPPPPRAPPPPPHLGEGPGLGCVNQINIPPISVVDPF